MKNDSVEAVIEDLRIWDPMFYSDSETKLLMKLAADYLDQYVVKMVTCDSCGLMHPKTDWKCPKCGAINNKRGNCLDCVHAIPTDLDGWVICQINDQAKCKYMVCNAYELNLK